MLDFVEQMEKLETEQEKQNLFNSVKSNLKNMIKYHYDFAFVLSVLNKKQRSEAFEILKDQLEFYYVHDLVDFLYLLNKEQKLEVVERLIK